MYRIEQVAEGNVPHWLEVRRDLYLASGLISPIDLDEDGSYCDQYDGYSRHVLVRDAAGRPQGCARLIVRNGPHQPLQVEKQFQVAVEIGSVEVSGFAVSAAASNGLASLGLARAMVELAREEGADHLYAEVEPWFFTSLRRTGFPFKAITDEQWLYNAWNFVAHVRVSAILDVVAASPVATDASAMATYFRRPWTWSISTEDLVPEQARPVRERV